MYGIILSLNHTQIIRKTRDVLIFGTPPFVKRMSLLDNILCLSNVYLPWQMLSLVVPILTLRYLQIHSIFLKSAGSECYKRVRALITNDLLLGSESTLGRSLISINLRHKAVYNTKIRIW
jgi:hypothetical protein